MTQGKENTLITPKQILERLPIAFKQVKTGNTSKHLLNENCQIIYSLYLAKEDRKMFIIR